MARRALHATFCSVLSVTVADSFPLWDRQARSHPDLATVALNPGIIDTEMLQSTFGASSADFPAPAAWAEKAVPFLEKIGPRDNGKALTALQGCEFSTVVKEPSVTYFAPMKVDARSISTDGTTDRRKHLRDALGNAALEGIKPSPQAMADLQEVVRGTLTKEQCRQRVKARYGIQE